jgi:hypothetical protein
MALSPALVDELAAEYRETEALAAVEADHVEMLPTMFETGEFGWRDTVWVVRWYYRRFLGAVPNADRRAGEDAFQENTFGDVRSVIQDVTEREDVEFRLDRLTSLQAVDVPVASAFLQFIEPSSYLVVGEREWTVLADDEQLSDTYPSPPTVEDYRRYLEAARAVAQRCDCDMWTLYQAIWRQYKRTHGGAGGGDD